MTENAFIDKLKSGWGIILLVIVMTIISIGRFVPAVQAADNALAGETTTLSSQTP